MHWHFFYTGPVISRSKPVNSRLIRICLFCGIFVLLAPCFLFGQRRGGRGSGGRTAPSGGGDTETDEAKQFERAAAIQARPEQVTQFQAMTKSDQAARTSTQDLLQHAGTADQPDLFHYTKSITVAVDEAQSESSQFLHSFSDRQKKELKELTKKLGRASSDVTKENKALSRELERSKVNGKHLSEVAKKLDDALGDFQSRQVAVGTEMGITGISKPL